MIQILRLFALHNVLLPGLGSKIGPLGAMGGKPPKPSAPIDFAIGYDIIDC
jgi:hypothetical protein